MMAGIFHFRLPVCARLAMAVLIVFSAMVSADDESMQELLAKALAPGDRQAELYAKLARRQVEVANDLFNQGEVEKGQAAIKDVVGFAWKALESAKQSKKRLKQTEITLRKTSRRLSDVAGTLAFEERPAINQAVKEIDEIRTQVLELIFGPSRKSEKSTALEADPKGERAQ